MKIDLNILIAARSLIDTLINNFVNNLDELDKEQIKDICEHKNKLNFSTMLSPDVWECKDCGEKHNME